MYFQISGYNTGAPHQIFHQPVGIPYIRQGQPIRMQQSNQAHMNRSRMSFQQPPPGILVNYSSCDQRHEILIHSRPENLKKSRSKKLVKSNKSKYFFCEIAFLAVLNFFPVQKLIFGHFWNCKKWNLGKQIFSWNWFIWFYEFFWPGLF